MSKEKRNKTFPVPITCASCGLFIHFSESGGWSRGHRSGCPHGSSDHSNKTADPYSAYVEKKWADELSGNKIEWWSRKAIYSVVNYLQDFPEQAANIKEEFDRRRSAAAMIRSMCETQQLAIDKAKKVLGGAGEK